MSTALHVRLIVSADGQPILFDSDLSYPPPYGSLKLPVAFHQLVFGTAPTQIMPLNLRIHPFQLDPASPEALQPCYLISTLFLAPLVVTTDQDSHSEFNCKMRFSVAIVLYTAPATAGTSPFDAVGWGGLSALPLLFPELLSIFWDCVAAVRITVTAAVQCLLDETIIGTSVRTTCDAAAAHSMHLVRNFRPVLTAGAFRNHPGFLALSASFLQAVRSILVPAGAVPCVWSDAFELLQSVRPQQIKSRPAISGETNVSGQTISGETNVSGQTISGETNVSGQAFGVSIGVGRIAFDAELPSALPQLQHRQRFTPNPEASAAVESVETLLPRSASRRSSQQGSSTADGDAQARESAKICQVESFGSDVLYALLYIHGTKPESATAEALARARRRWHVVSPLALFLHPLTDSLLARSLTLMLARHRGWLSASIGTFWSRPRNPCDTCHSSTEGSHPSVLAMSKHILNSLGSARFLIKSSDPVSASKMARILASFIFLPRLRERTFDIHAAISGPHVVPDKTLFEEFAVRYTRSVDDYPVSASICSSVMQSDTTTDSRFVAPDNSVVHRYPLSALAALRPSAYLPGLYLCPRSLLRAERMNLLHSISSAVETPLLLGSRPSPRGGRSLDNLLYGTMSMDEIHDEMTEKVNSESMVQIRVSKTADSQKVLQSNDSESIHRKEIAPSRRRKSTDLLHPSSYASELSGSSQGTCEKQSTSSADVASQNTSQVPSSARSINGSESTAVTLAISVSSLRPAPSQAYFGAALVWSPNPCPFVVAAIMPPSRVAQPAPGPSSASKVAGFFRRRRRSTSPPHAAHNPPHHSGRNSRVLSATMLPPFAMPTITENSVRSLGPNIQWFRDTEGAVVSDYVRPISSHPPRNPDISFATMRCATLPGASTFFGGRSCGGEAQPLIEFGVHPREAFVCATYGSCSAAYVIDLEKKDISCSELPHCASVPHLADGCVDERHSDGRADEAVNRAVKSGKHTPEEMPSAEVANFLSTVAVLSRLGFDEKSLSEFKSSFLVTTAMEASILASVAATADAPVPASAVAGVLTVDRSHMWLLKELVQDIDVKAAGNIDISTCMGSLAEERRAADLALAFQLRQLEVF